MKKLAFGSLLGAAIAIIAGLAACGSVKDHPADAPPADSPNGSAECIFDNPASTFDGTCLFGA